MKDGILMKTNRSSRRGNSVLIVIILLALVGGAAVFYLTANKPMKELEPTASSKLVISPAPTPTKVASKPLPPVKVNKGSVVYYYMDG